MYNRQLEIADVLRSDPAVAYLNSTVGSGGPNATNNYGRFLIALKPRSERKATRKNKRIELRVKARASN
jgi:HAE1 family hydrophobic/amphiphilic exporter-1